MEASGEVPRHSRGVRLAGVVVGVVAAVAAAAGSWRASPTDDEPTYVGQGRYLLATGDFHAPVLLWQPPLGLYVQALGAPFVDIRPEALRHGASVESLTALGDALIFESPSPPEAVLRSARLPVAVATGLLAALAALVAGRLAGAVAAWLAGLLVGLSPAVYGHGGLATTDAVAALGALAAVAGVLPLIRPPPASGWSRRRALAAEAVAGALFGVALLAKHTALALAPLVVAVVYVAARRRGASRGGATGRVALALATSAAVVWAGYGFDVGRLVPPESRGDLANRLAAFVPLPREWVESFARTVPVPAPRWFQSLVFQASKQHGRLFFRYFDETAKTGWWTYFLVVTAGKLTLGSLALVLLAAATRRARRLDAAERVLAAAFLLPFAAAVVSRHNLGVRHVLPPLIPLLVLAAVRVARRVAAQPRARAFVAGAVVLAAVHVVEGVSALPSPVAWWNRAFGGTEGGWRVAAGSNADWGQGLWELRDLVRREGLHPVRLVAEAPASALAHLDEPAIEVLAWDWWRKPQSRTGWLAVSTSAPWTGGRPPLGGTPPDRFVAGCYRLWRLPLDPR